MGNLSQGQGPQIHGRIGTALPLVFTLRLPVASLTGGLGVGLGGLDHTFYMEIIGNYISVTVNLFGGPAGTNQSESRIETTYKYKLYVNLKKE